MKIMVTGHRPQRLKGQEKEISLWLNEQIQKFKPDVAISGMAAGADQLWAMAALDNDIPLLCYFPYPRQIYHPQEQYIVERAAGIKYICPEYSKDSYELRDRAMVDDSDIVLAVWDGILTGGTYKTHHYAEERQKEIYSYMVKI